MKKVFWGLFTSIVFIALGLFFYFFEYICFTRTPKKVIGPFVTHPSETIYYCLPLHWAYILIGLGAIPLLISIYLYYRNRSQKKPNNPGPFGLSSAT